MCDCEDEKCLVLAYDESTGEWGMIKDEYSVTYVFESKEDMQMFEEYVKGFALFK